MHNLLLAALLSATGIQAQNIAGNWQGTLGDGSDKIRLVLRISKAQSRMGGGWAGTFFSIDRNPDWGLGDPLKSVTFLQGKLAFKLDDKGDTGAFEGSITSDGDSILGAWTEGGFRQPLAFRRATGETAWKDSSAHSVKFVSVGGGVRVEVLDWGGSGRSVLLLAGLGNTAHVFDSLADKLSASYRVYGLTRRGFGASSAPTSGYGADRLADDVLKVVDSLKLHKPVLIGHSIAGQELSSIGSRHPDKVAGLIYVDAGYSYAYYDTNLGNADLAGIPDLRTLPPAHVAILQGRQKYTRIQGPVLAIYAFGQRSDPTPAEAQANAFEKSVPGARVVRFPKADHYIFLTDEATVLSQIEMFIAALP